MLCINFKHTFSDMLISWFSHFVFYQGILVYMFRELMNYCVTMSVSSGVYSLASQHSSTHSFVILSFWSTNDLHRVCRGSSPHGMLLLRKILILPASFISLFDVPASCIALIGVGDKLDDCLSSTLPGSKRPCIVNTFGPPILRPV